MVQNLFSISSFFKIKFMFKHIFYAVLLFISATTSQCSKTTTAVPDDPNALPPETQTGANTYACKINGVVWKYRDHEYKIFSQRSNTILSFHLEENGGTISLAGIRYETNDEASSELGISASYLNQNRSTNLSSDKKKFSLAYTNYNTTVNGCYEFVTTYLSDPSYPANIFQEGKLTVTKLDTVAHIISGTFSCSILHTGCDTLKITDGRFDFKY